jgi:hypothetical protein
VEAAPGGDLVRGADPMGDWTLPAGLVEFNTVWFYLCPALWTPLFVWWWLRRHKFPISRRLPNFMLATMLCIVVTNMNFSFGVVWPHLYYCVTWLLASNMLGSICFAIFFARSVYLLYMTRLQHEK